MAIQLVVDLERNNVAGLFGALASIDKKAVDPALREIGETIRSMAIDAFEDEKSPEGEGWKQSIRAKKTGGQTLSDKEILRNSIEYAINGDEVEIGSNMVYAAIHQLGGEAGPKSRRIELPARPYLPDPEQDLLGDEVLAIIGEHLKRALNA